MSLLCVCLQVCVVVLFYYYYYYFILEVILKVLRFLTAVAQTSERITFGYAFSIPQIHIFIF